MNRYKRRSHLHFKRKRIEIGAPGPSSWPVAARFSTHRRARVTLSAGQRPWPTPLLRRPPAATAAAARCRRRRLPRPSPGPGTAYPAQGCCSIVKNIVSFY